MTCRLGIVLLALQGLVVLATGQGLVEGTFAEHALVRVGTEEFAVAQGRTVEIRSWANPNRVSRTLRGAEAFVVSLAVSPDGRLLAAGDKDGHIMVWEIASGQLLFKKYAHRFSVWSVAFSPDGVLLASGAFDGTVRLWDTGSWVEVGLLIEPRLVDAENKDRAHMGWVRCVAFSPDGRTLATSGCDGYVRIWDVDTLRLRRDAIQAGINVYFVSFSPDGELLGCVTNPGEIRLYRTDTWEEAMRLRAGRTSSLYVMSFSPEGAKVFAGGFSNKVEVWDLATGKMLSEHPGHTDSIWGLIVFPDGRRVVTTSRDNTVRLWTIEN
ncbi:MAG TPA: WD40 repeat domain-containing protein [Candidatus Acetothermia bacterium]|mgnify:CR=1 FL=1|nr:WD40 repeat domain-containing protein [Candidatus Acetothermia bacterium]